MDTDAKYKQISQSGLRRFLVGQITPTPYLYAFLMDKVDDGNENTESEEVVPSTDDEEFFTLCINCDSWMKRQQNKRPVLLHADAVFLNIISPGRFELPEERSCLRIIRNCCDENQKGMFLVTIAPKIVLEFLSVYRNEFLGEKGAIGVSPRAKASTVKTQRKLHKKHHFRIHVVLVWWRRNRFTEFCSNKHIAKVLRRTLYDTH